MSPLQSWIILILAIVAAWLYYSKESSRKTSWFNQSIPFLDNKQNQASQRRTNKKATNKAQPHKTSNGSAQSSNDSDIPVVASASGPSTITNKKQLRQRKSTKGISDPIKSLPKQAVVSSAVEPDVSDVVTSEKGSLAGETFHNNTSPKQLSDSKLISDSNSKTATSLAPIAPVSSTSDVKTSNDLTSLDSTTSKTKSKNKNSRANGKTVVAADPKNTSSSQVTSTASSTGGMDADDDLSSSNSPLFDPTPTFKNANSHDVSDMLEAPAAGPSVLRLTDPNQQAPQKQPKQTTNPQSQETKRQRQNRQKKEANRLAREQTEKDRRVLLEQQLRTARVAEGRPAKNGTAAAKAPITNAWTTPVQPTSIHNPSPAIASTTYAAPLLDTFDKETSATKAWERDLPSEEDQMRMIKEMNGEGGWKTVDRRRKRKDTAGSGTATSSGETSEAGSGPAPVVGGAGHPNDSDWAVV